MGLEHTIFCSRKKAEARPGWSDWAVISISEPEPSNTLLYGPAQLQTGWGQILRLEFHDIDEPEEPYILFTGKQAREIIQFVRECDEPDSALPEFWCTAAPEFPGAPQSPCGLPKNTSFLSLMAIRCTTNAYTRY